ncbi:aminotransferase class I/II-fold pyridoxal phosphate-dependent enzyme [Nocardioides sp. LHG3406-4]|uniref:aminotransferase class I/II-fold pyridoxal phosphate-dependent enzyme n=1 Tax=Nocardioides sp. LHG3406-4 TaxID=2804575 RepID=UPI003CF7A6E4
MSIGDLVAATAAQIEEEGVVPEPVVESPMSGRARFAGREDPLVVLCSNNYLGLASDPDVVAATVAAVHEYGAGSAAARFIAGTTPVHLALEAALAELVGTAAAVTFSSCSTANHAVLATLADKQTLICSDELNHASIIDGVRLARAGAKQVYPHADLDALRELLTSHPLRDQAIVVTDGVFSMEGDLAPLPDLVDLCRRHGAFLVVDDSHATGVLGEHGRGTTEQLGVLGEVDAVTGTLGKALGGAAGGFVAGSADLARVLRRHARPYIFSNPVPPGVAAGSLRAIGRLREDPSLLARLRTVTERLRAGLSELDLEVLAGESAIIPCIVGEESRARHLGDALLDEGVLVTPFAYPVVPRGTARLRVQASAALSDDDVDRALTAFRSVTRLS